MGSDHSKSVDLDVLVVVSDDEPIDDKIVVPNSLDELDDDDFDGGLCILLVIMRPPRSCACVLDLPPTGHFVVDFVLGFLS